MPPSEANIAVTTPDGMVRRVRLAATEAGVAIAARLDDDARAVLARHADLLAGLIDLGARIPDELAVVILRRELPPICAGCGGHVSHDGAITIRAGRFALVCGACNLQRSAMRFHRVEVG
jgi:hypothetical protein